MTLQLRAHGIRQQLGSSLTGQPTRVHLLSKGTGWISYFNELGPVEVECGNHRWSISMGESLVPSQVLIILAHGTDISCDIWQIKAAAPALTVGVWLWDNHVAHLNNLRTVLAADMYFPSHQFAADYLCNPWSIHGGNVPLCTGQWLPSDIASVFAETEGVPRRDELYAAYVDYGFSARSGFLRGMREAVPGSDVKLMQPESRERFFGMSKQDQLREWCQYK